MPRKELKPRERRGMPDPDYKYQSVLAARFIGRLNFCGKKMTGERIFYTALKLIQDKMKEEPLAVFTRAIENVRPLLEVRPRRVGGATYQVPQEVRPERGARPLHHFGVLAHPFAAVRGTVRHRQLQALVAELDVLLNVVARA
ncbi:MAG TPA: hypothetical protein P5079_05540, partial [Elusimicrobiota bacterium]|nr:hypothetical protein [Elusimicrobiota bacterium]